MLHSTQRAQHREPSFGAVPSAPTHFSVCYTPRPGSALAQFGRSWFGRANDGTTLQAFSASGLGGDAPAGITPTPGRYFGLHAPFFAPAPLRGDAGLDEVRTHLEQFAANRKPIETGPLKLTRMRRSLVLQPAEPRPELDWLALQCFNAFDSYAEMADTADDEHPHLSRYQRLLLRSFGQPNVMSEYRFALRLTGPLDERQIELVSVALRPLIADLCADGVCVDGLSLIGSTPEEANGHASGQTQGTPVRLLGRYSLAG
ncbi:hypothetical protein AUC70_08695 [Methyloceanibacter stevinii]|uniref:Uncharacterized protein n=1 Tax=Methyloceanibacter stevinii TaxID=1774970 RepID=A0A1E3VN03_9HYPH|nr:DUF1045 domain-containing protein [Methyloceanibacter stevinii]ODR94681.1 hypothetical protein AUC70_08695 [Methyloceanibacter stevinii]